MGNSFSKIPGCIVSELNCSKESKLVQISWQKKSCDQYYKQRWMVGRVGESQVKFYQLLTWKVFSGKTPLLGKFLLGKGHYLESFYWRKFGKFLPFPALMDGLGGQGGFGGGRSTINGSCPLAAPIILNNPVTKRNKYSFFDKETFSNESF